MKASVVYYPNVAKKNLKTGKIPMYMRVCYQRTKAESRLNAELGEIEIENYLKQYHGTEFSPFN